MTAMNLYRRSILQTSLVLLLAAMIGFTTMAAQRRKPHKHGPAGVQPGRLG
jgi:hypothetical protein